MANGTGHSKRRTTKLEFASPIRACTHFRCWPKCLRNSQGRSRLRKMWNNEISYVANEWRKVDSLENDFDHVCRTLRKRMARFVKRNDEVAISEIAAGTSALSASATPSGPSGGTDLLRDLTTDKALTPWIPFWRLDEQGGLIDWNAALDRMGTAIPPAIFAQLSAFGVQDFGPAIHSWLCLGCGIAAVRRYAE